MGVKQHGHVSENFFSLLFLSKKTNYLLLLLFY